MGSKFHAKAAITALVLMVTGAVGCTSSPTLSSSKITCLQRDWYELGRRDGSQGATLDRKAHYRAECGSEFNSDLETIYLNGRNAGLVEYCSPDSAFQLGRMGISYKYVCPPTMEQDFLVGYRKGTQARDLELRGKDLDARIDSVAQKILGERIGDQREQLATQLDQLKELRAQTERELTEISN